jgi:hypothetical protein
LARNSCVGTEKKTRFRSSKIVSTSESEKRG